ncbi:hypothetical protein GUJ93_ZPchr0010g8240 [Zizania palustris]|uniref:Uncharacterized protein n=1 Tax=Zizania palustris TaxID=103762 RepID=A0A8J5WFT4_ZIZPA|nr:hypothetical protein GUJ93_ZPchr0010g8240 [Zizania palustris]
MLRASKFLSDKDTELVMQVDRSNILVTTLEIIDHIIWNGGDSLQCSTFNHEARFRALRLPLRADDLTTSLGICLDLIILDFPQTKLLSAPGWLNMLHPDMDPLPDDAVPNLKKLLCTHRKEDRGSALLHE